MTEDTVGPVLSHKVGVARTHALWRQALTVGNPALALETLDALDALEDGVPPGNLRVEMRLWQAEALLRAGKTGEAQTRVRQLEALDGQSAGSRLIAARLRLYANDFAACAEACAEALVLCGPEGTAYPAIYRLWAEALCLMGEHDRARVVLERIFANRKTLTTDDLRALRQTVVTAGALDAFGAFVSGFMDPDHPLARAAMFHYAMACRDLGRHERAIAAIRHRLLVFIEREKFGQREKPRAPSGWTADAGTALHDLKRAMDGTGTPFFLISGTLLGCVREGAILAHDKDIDVGVMETTEAQRDAVHRALSGSGVFLVFPYEKPSLLRLQHSSGVAIDIFWHRIEQGRLIHEGIKSQWWNTPFALEPTEFLGETYLIPADSPRYLGENYDDWERPDPAFETFVDTPNMIITEPEAMIWSYYAKLLDYYGLGKRAQFFKIFDRLVEARPEDHAVRRIGYRLLDLLSETEACAAEDDNA